MRQFHILLTIIFLTFSLSFHAQETPPKREVRAVWLTTIGGIDWPHSYAQSGRSAEKQQQELCQILDKLQKAGVNTILLQTRIRGTMIYPSQYEPWDGCLSGFPGKSPGYDALKFAIEECHKRGMELHAWVVTIPVGKWNALGCKSLRRKFPKLIRKIDQDGYMNPEDPQTAKYLADICAEITKNYDIDGIHLDYIRYPETWKIRVSNDQGRKYITHIVEAIHDKVKALKPWVKMSCSPIGKFDDLSRYWSHGWNAYTKVCQDAQGWLRSGLMDELFPMMYFKNNQFFPFAIDWAENSHGKIIAPGLGVYFLDRSQADWPLETVTREMEILRQFQLGHAYFRSKFFTDDTKGIYDFAYNDFDAFPALIPAMTWIHDVAPSAPTKMQVTNDYISWEGAKDHSDASYLLYNVYSSREYPVDIHDPRNLISPRLQQTRLNITTSGRYFAVTAMDRYGNESTALQSASTPLLRKGQKRLSCNGESLILPAKPSTLDAEMVSIETLQGTIIASKRYEGKSVDVSSIPNGVYLLRSLNRKGISHRLGFFEVRREP